MLKLTASFTLALLCVSAFGYGYTYAMTAERFPIEGYIGALIPVAFVAVGTLMGLILARQN